MIRQLVIRDYVVMHMLNKAAQNTVVFTSVTLQILNLATLMPPFYMVFVSVHYYM